MFTKCSLKWNASTALTAIRLRISGNIAIDGQTQDCKKVKTDSNERWIESKQRLSKGLHAEMAGIYEDRL